MRKYLPRGEWLRIVLILTAGAGVFLCCLGQKGENLADRFSKNQFAEILIGGQKITVAVVSSMAEVQRGLGRIGNLSPNEGMFFVFPEEDYHGIWMKDMKFPIDIFWLGKDGEIFDIKEKISPETYPEVFYPRQISSSVLETSAGFAEKNGIKIGDKIIFSENVTK